MTFEQQLTLTVVDKALISVLLLVTGFWLNRTLERFKYELGLATGKSQIARQSEMQFMEKQLAEFYGPIYALLRKIRPLDDLWNQRRLGRVDSHAVHQIRDANNRIVEIILTKSHLIAGDSIPATYSQFITHVTIWHAFLDTPRADWSIYAKLPAAQYDIRFEENIFGTTEELKRRLSVLYRHFGLTSPTDAAREEPHSARRN